MGSTQDNRQPFELIEVVGRGGMGVVWRARHRSDGAEVALKLLVGDGVDADALQREVEATAVLSHPHIVAVYDLGSLPADRLVHPDAPPGSPYFAMELLLGGSLREHAGTLHWTGVRHVLLALLDALGHAHARGVVHLDLKPANVLRDVDGEWRLVDFGIARAMWEPGKTVGTPAFMAPEQLRGDRDALGSHTDLFALGTLGWYLVTGEVPRSGAPGAILSQALAGSPGVFEPRFRVPDELEPWLRALMEPDPRDRVRVAADAAHALASLPEFAAAPEGVVGVPAREVSSTFTLDAVTTALTPAEGVRAIVHDVASLSPPPLPASWEEPDRVRPVPSSLGLGLFGVRPMPFAGRQAERDALFAALRQVHAGERVWVHITGPSGLGRSRLGEWLGHRASELGIATTYAPGRRVDRLRSALLDQGLPEVRELARELGVPVDSPRIRALDDWLRTGVSPGVVVAEQFFADLIAARSQERPVVVWLDDLDEAGRRLVRLLERGRILVLSASQRSEPADRVLSLAPLADTELRSLLLHLLGLQERLAHELSERAGGSPRFIHQVLSMLVERGSLRPTPDGYALPDGLPLDDSVDGVGIEGWLQTRADRDAIELGAVLGPRVEAGVWTAALAEAGLAPSEDLLDRGRRLGWIRRMPDGWAFADAAAHARLVAAPQAARWHAVAAAVLDPEKDRGRVARHYLAMGDLAAAVPHLRARAMRANEEGDLSGARRWYREASRAFLDLGDRAQHAEMVGWEAWMAYQLGDLAEGRRLADEVLSAGTRLRDPNLVASGAHTKGVIEGALGTAAAEPLLLQAARLYREGNEIPLAAQAEASGWSSAPPTRARLDALAALTESMVDKSAVIAGMVGRSYAQALLRAGLDAEALAAATAAVERFRDTRVRQGVVAASVQIGHAQVGLGDYDAADAAYLRGFRALVDYSGGRHVEATLYLGVSRLLRRQWREASRLIRRSARRLETYGWVEHTTAVRFAQLALLAWEGEEDRFDVALLEAVGHAQRVAFPPELALDALLALAADVWDEQGQPERAAQARAARTRIPARAVAE